MRTDHWRFLFANLAFGPAIGFSTVCLPLFLHILFRQGIELGELNVRGLGGLFVAFSFALVLGILPAFLNFLLMLPFIKKATRRTVLLVSPFTGFVATAMFNLPSLTAIERGWPNLVASGLLGVVPAVSCTLIAFRLEILQHAEATAE